MENQKTIIQDQYKISELFEDILFRLNREGVNLNALLRTDIEKVDEFHLGGATATKEIVSQFDFKDLKVLDIGCGIGGPCRMLADEFNCTVSGLDLSHEYIRTAQKLSELIEINGSTEFKQGDALNLPYSDASFDVVWTQHVQMNIENKEKFYSEINRVLKANGTLIYYDIFKKNNEAIKYPVPWANNESASFLESIANMEAILDKIGLNKIQSTDQSNAGINFLTKVIDKIKTSGLPNLGLNVLIGPEALEKLRNVSIALKTNKIELQTGIYKK